MKGLDLLSRRSWDLTHLILLDDLPKLNGGLIMGYLPDEIDGVSFRSCCLGDFL